MNNVLNNSWSNVSDDLKNLKDAELTEKMQKLAILWDFTSPEFKKLQEEWERRKNKSIEWSQSSEDIEKSVSEILNKNTLEQTDKDDLKKLILEEIKKHKQSGQKTKKQIDDKDTEIARLMWDLEKEKSNMDKILTDDPSIKEYFSLERKRLAKINRKFRKLKEDKSKYPKNLLIYAMWITNSKIFWTRQMLKRWRASIAWKWRDADVVNNLEIIFKKINSDNNWKDSERKKAIKNALYKEIEDALKAHREKLIKWNTLPDYKK